MIKQTKIKGENFISVDELVSYLEPKIREYTSN